MYLEYNNLCVAKVICEIVRGFRESSVLRLVCRYGLAGSHLTAYTRRTVSRNKRCTFAISHCEISCHTDCD